MTKMSHLTSVIGGHQTKLETFRHRRTNRPTNMAAASRIYEWYLSEGQLSHSFAAEMHALVHDIFRAAKDLWMDWKLEAASIKTTDEEMATRAEGAEGGDSGIGSWNNWMDGSASWYGQNGSHGGSGDYQWYGKDGWGDEWHGAQNYYGFPRPSGPGSAPRALLGRSFAHPIRASLMSQQSGFSSRVPTALHPLMYPPRLPGARPSGFRPGVGGPPVDMSQAPTDSHAVHYHTEGEYSPHPTRGPGPTKPRLVRNIPRPIEVTSLSEFCTPINAAHNRFLRAVTQCQMQSGNVGEDGKLLKPEDATSETLLDAHNQLADCMFHHVTVRAGDKKFYSVLYFAPNQPGSGPPLEPKVEFYEVGLSSSNSLQRAMAKALGIDVPPLGEPEEPAEATSLEFSTKHSEAKELFGSAGDLLSTLAFAPFTYSWYEFNCVEEAYIFYYAMIHGLCAQAARFISTDDAREHYYLDKAIRAAALRRQSIGGSRARGKEGEDGAAGTKFPPPWSLDAEKQLMKRLNWAKFTTSDGAWAALESTGETQLVTNDARSYMGDLLVHIRHMIRSALKTEDCE